MKSKRSDKNFILPSIQKVDGFILLLGKPAENPSLPLYRGFNLGRESEALAVVVGRAGEAEATLCGSSANLTVGISSFAPLHRQPQESLASVIARNVETLSRPSETP